MLEEYKTKNRFKKLFGFCVIFIILIGMIISSSSILINKESTPEKLGIDKSNKLNSDPIFDIIEMTDESLLYDYLEELTVKIGPRKVGTSSCEIAGEYIFEQFENMGLETRYQEWESWTPRHKRFYRSKNVEAILPGNSKFNDEIIIVNAHYDTVPDVSGAIDDGTGTVAVMAAAYALSQYKFNRTIKFVAFSGEEYGLLGSRAYANEIYEDNPNLLVQLNLDGIGYATTALHSNNVLLASTEDAKWMVEEIKNVNKNYDIDFNIRFFKKIAPGGPRQFTSDFHDFVLHGYEAIAFGGSEDYPHWHTPEDTIDKVNFGYLANMTKLIVASLAHLADIEVYYPQIRISSPKRGRLYFEDVTLKKFNYARTVVLDDILICTYVKPGDASIENVKFYYDGKLVFTDSDAPYQWRLNKRSIKEHAVEVILYDKKGRTARDQVTFRYINLFLKK